MDFKKLSEYALETAREELAEHFSWNAFLVYSIAVNNLNTPSDDIKGTDIDDNIKNIFDDFSKYYAKKNNGENSEKELFDMLSSLKRIVVELFYQADSNDKAKIREIVEEIGKSIGG